MDFCTLGMFIIDDIYPPPSAPKQTPQTNIIGGAGTFSAIGARLFSPPPKSKSVGWIIDAGTDFPSDLHETISTWETGVLIRPRDAPTTRGWNGYGENEHRAFKYLTEKKRLTAEDLTGELLAAKSFHLICSAVRCAELAQRIRQRRAEELCRDHPQPIIVWEPVPDMCTPDQLQETKDALRHIDVLSPNHDELGALFGVKHAGGVDKSAVEEHAQELAASRIGSQGKGVIVVRSGKEGCYIAHSGNHKNSCWMPAFHTDQSKVVDPTGGGNGFLGGFSVGLVRSGFDVIAAARWGSVAASFCIEQVGMPQLTSKQQDPEGELWNGVSVADRLEELMERSKQEGVKD